MENTFVTQRKSKTGVVLALIALAAVVGAICYVTFTPSETSLTAPSDFITEDEKHFMRWMYQHNKDYFSREEYNFRFNQWKADKTQVAHHNARNDATYTKAVNQFSDLTNEEFARFYLGLKPDANEMLEEEYLPEENTSSSVDWRKKGAVTGVKNQGHCGSCWAFSATGSIEGAYKLAGHSLTSFSEQQLVDCSGSYGNNGCGGGLMNRAFSYVEDYKLEKESSYPYQAKDESCRYKSKEGVTNVRGYSKVSAKDSQLMAAIDKQPVSIGVDAECFKSYSSGILYPRDCTYNTNHGVLAVGYTSSYYIVKNSWGSSWGESGYVRLAPGNTANMLHQASYPKI